MSDGTCPGCSRQITTGLMAAFCPRATACTLYPKDPDAQGFIEDMRGTMDPTIPAIPLPVPAPITREGGESVNFEVRRMHRMPLPITDETPNQPYAWIDGLRDWSIKAAGALVACFALALLADFVAGRLG